MTFAENWLFWIVAGGMILALGLFLWTATYRAGSGRGSRTDVAIYRDQLGEIDRDEARGLIDPAEAVRMRTEVSRRLLAADRATPLTTTTTSSRGMGLGVAAVVGVGVIAVYVRLGAPGYPDMPMAERIALAADLRANRPGQTEAEARQADVAAPAVSPELAALLDRLRTAVAERPDLLQGQSYLVEYELRAGNLAAAARAQAQFVRLKGGTATATDHATLADLLIRAAGGYVSPEAERALTAALTLDPANGPARYYSGLMLAQTGRPDLAFDLWRGLLDDSAPTDPWAPLIRRQIEGLALLAGETYVLPAEAVPGPTGDDIAAAADMTDADRKAMIAGMIDRLANRLATEGGPATDWARLITALGQQGQTDRARAIWVEARGVFAAVPADLSVVRQAAVAAGIAE